MSSSSFVLVLDPKKRHFEDDFSSRSVGWFAQRDSSLAILLRISSERSSIFIATPVVLWWSRLRGKSIRREVFEAETPSSAPSVNRLL